MRKLFLMAAIFPLSALAEDNICTDSPTKSNATCTVPMGQFQTEADVVNYTHTSKESIYKFTSPTIKYGLLDDLDIEANAAPIEEIVTKGQKTLYGTGDLYLRVKYNALDDGSSALSFIPWVKIPTALSGIGNKYVEEGIIVPMSFTLPSGFNLVLDPEMDNLKNLGNASYHLNYQSTISIDHSIFTHNLRAYVEFWTQDNKDPDGDIKQDSADLALSYLVNPDMQVDIGNNIGLNRFTPTYQLYAGVSQRF